MNFKTQFDAGSDPDDVTKSISHFMSPAYLQVGLGMLRKKNDNFKINIAPATARFIFVHKHFTDFEESFWSKTKEKICGLNLELRLTHITKLL